MDDLAPPPPLFPLLFSQLPSKTWVWDPAAGLNVSLQNEAAAAPPENGEEKESPVHSRFLVQIGTKHFDWKMKFWCQITRDSSGMMRVSSQEAFYPDSACSDTEEEKNQLAIPLIGSVFNISKGNGTSPFNFHFFIFIFENKIQ